jgi:hypothetical protein
VYKNENPRILQVSFEFKWEGVKSPREATNRLPARAKAMWIDVRSQGNEKCKTLMTALL